MQLIQSGTAEALAADANELYDLATTSAESAVDYAQQCGQKLIEAKAMMKHGEWLPWLAANFKGSHKHATRYMKIASNMTRVSSLPEPEKPESIRQALKLLASADKAAHQHITSSESVEWYTPQIYIEAAREVMGSIDLDPASNPRSNGIIKATQYYTEKENGLTKEWAGNVWLNPPYGKACADFIEKLHASPRVNQAVLLVNSNSNDTTWFRPLWDRLLCFTYGRVNFYGPNGEASGPTHGSCFVYFGSNRARFIDIFGEFGAVATC